MSSNHDTIPPEATTRRDVIAVTALMVLAAAPRIAGLNAQLWIDEISAFGSIRRPVGTILTSWPGAASHVLYEFLAHVSWRLFGDAPWTLRLPAVLFGIASVWAFYLLARLIARDAATFLTALFALSYHGIFFAQNARGYTALLFFFLLSSATLARMAAEGRIRTRAALVYGGSTALAAYAQPLGAFVLAGHAATVLGWESVMRLRGKPGLLPAARFAWLVVGTGAVVALLYAPFVASVIRFTQQNIASPGEGPRLGFALIREVVEGLGTAFGGLPGVVVAGSVGLLGLIALARRAGFALGTLVVPIVVQGAVLVALGMGIHPRYFAVALPVVYLVGGYGVYRIVRWITRLAVPSPQRERLVAATLLALIVLASAAPLIRYYRYPKQDFLGAAETVRAATEPGDVRVGVRFAGNVLAGYYDLPYQVVDSLPQLRELEAMHRRIWVITTLERLVRVEDPALIEHLHAGYRVVRRLPGTVGDGTVHVYLLEP